MPRFYKNTDAPTTPEQGDIQYNLTSNRLEVFNGTTWANITFGTTTTAALTAGATTVDSLTVSAGFASTNAATPAVYIPGEAGVGTGTVASLGKRVALYYDTTNNRLQFRHGGSWYTTVTLNLA